MNLTWTQCRHKKPLSIIKGPCCIGIQKLNLKKLMMDPESKGYANERNHCSPPRNRVEIEEL